MSHAGHHTPQIMTGVYIPQTSQPKAASLRTSPMLTLKYVETEYSAAVGDASWRKAAHAQRTAGWRGQGCMKDSGLAMTPTRKAKEKLRVARAERNMPSKRRENDLMS